MLTQQTLEKLREMRLTGLAEAYMSQNQDPNAASLSFDERFSLLVDHEATYRHNRRLERLLKEAKLHADACVEDIAYHPPRGLDKSVMAGLAPCGWVEQGHRVLITGATGCGKTYIACALGHAACRHGYRTRYYRLTSLLREVAIAQADGTYPRLLARLSKTQLLILDDLGLKPLTPQEARELLEILDDRTAQRSTIITSQFPVDEWHHKLGDPTVADAILDRLVHGSHHLTMRGESMRKHMHQARRDGAGSEERTP